MCRMITRSNEGFLKSSQEALRQVISLYNKKVKASKKGNKHENQEIARSQKIKMTLKLSENQMSELKGT